MKKILFIIFILTVFFLAGCVNVFQPQALNQVPQPGNLPVINQQVNPNQAAPFYAALNNFQVIYTLSGGTSANSNKITILDSGKVTSEITDNSVNPPKVTQQTKQFSASQFLLFQNLLKNIDFSKLADKYDCTGECQPGQANINFKIISNNQSKEIIINDREKVPLGLGTLFVELELWSNDFYKNALGTNTVVLQTLVKDKNTHKPVAGAIVYIGANGFWQCQTNDLGQCTITNKQFVHGDYGVGVYKKGYQRSFVRPKFVPGPNSLSVEIAPTTMPQSITLTGTVVEIITAAGSKSENHYFKIKTEKGDEYYLFNNIGNNTGFESFIDKEATITGYKSKGFIGWQYQETEGIYVEEIK